MRKAFAVAGNSRTPSSFLPVVFSGLHASGDSVRTPAPRGMAGSPLCDVSHVMCHASTREDHVFSV